MTPLPTDATIEKAVQLAGRAPSLHNSQPWRWVFDGSALRLFAVRDRLLLATDTTGGQALLSCGIALDHLRVAMAAARWRCSVARFPSPTRRDHLATVRFHRADIVTEADRNRADAILTRHTDRLPFATPPAWEDLVVVLRSLIDPDVAVLTVLPDECRPRLAHASELTAALRRYDSGYQAELRWWTGHAHAREGVPREALVTSEERSTVDVARAFPTVAAGDSRTDLDADHSVILALSTHSDAPDEVLRCGEALSTVLLEATVAGLATCPLTHLVELPRSRAIIHELTGVPQRPQVLLRIGLSSDPNPEGVLTPRRPLSDILDMPK